MALTVFAGVPGVGKSTLAAEVAARLPASLLVVNTVDGALRRYDVTESRPGLAAYGVVAALAEDQLRLGHGVVVDAVNPVRAARNLWRDLAERLGVPLRVVEVTCSDPVEHRRRVEQRHAERGGDGIVADWSRVVERTAEYEPYIGPRVVVDTALAGTPVEAILDYLRG